MKKGVSYAVVAEIPSDTTAVVAKGQTKITLGGDIRFRGFHIDNRNVINKDGYPKTGSRYKTPHENYYDYRVQLRLKAELSPSSRDGQPWLVLITNSRQYHLNLKQSIRLAPVMVVAKI